MREASLMDCIHCEAFFKRHRTLFSKWSRREATYFFNIIRKFRMWIVQKVCRTGRKSDACIAAVRHLHVGGFREKPSGRSLNRKVPLRQRLLWGGGFFGMALSVVEAQNWASDLVERKISCNFAAFSFLHMFHPFAFSCYAKNWRFLIFTRPRPHHFS